MTLRNLAVLADDARDNEVVASKLGRDSFFRDPTVLTGLSHTGLNVDRISPLDCSEEDLGLTKVGSLARREFDPSEDDRRPNRVEENGDLPLDMYK